MATRSDVRFDVDQLRICANNLEIEKETLEELSKEQKAAMETLRTEGWIGKGEEAFEEIVEEQLGKMMDVYAEMIHTMSDILTSIAVPAYEELVELAEKLTFPQ